MSKKMKVKMHLVEKEEFWDNQELGNYAFDRDRIWIRFGKDGFYPGVCSVAISGDPKEVPIWNWDSKRDCPTLHPSIRTRWKDKVLFHGFVTAGFLVYLPDSTVTPESKDPFD